MSTKTDFSAEEWKLVVRAPMMAALAVVVERLERRGKLLDAVMGP